MFSHENHQDRKTMEDDRNAACLCGAAYFCGMRAKSAA